MRQETTTRTLYKFEELSDKAKERAIEKETEAQGEYWDPSDYIYDDFVRMAAILGITIDSRDWTNTYGHKGSTPTIYYSGFWSQGDGACFEGSYEYAKGSVKAMTAETNDKELIRIARELQALQKPFFYGLTATMKHRGHYSHSGCMEVDTELKWDDGDNWQRWQEVARPWEELTQLMRDFANWIYKSLEAEYDYQTSREQVIESIEANEYEFDEDGNLA